MPTREGIEKEKRRCMLKYGEALTIKGERERFNRFYQSLPWSVHKYEYRGLKATWLEERSLFIVGDHIGTLTFMTEEELLTWLRREAADPGALRYYITGSYTPLHFPYQSFAEPKPAKKEKRKSRPKKEYKLDDFMASL